MEQLPLLPILLQLNDADIASVLATCSTHHTIFEKDELWSTLLQRDFHLCSPISDIRAYYIQQKQLVPSTTESLLNCIQYGQVHLVRYAHEIRHLPLPTTTITKIDAHVVSTIYLAAANNHLPMAQWLYDQGIALDQYCLSVACVQGYLPLVQWMLAQGMMPTEQMVDSAARNGHFPVVKYLIQYDLPLGFWSLYCSLHTHQYETVRNIVSQGLNVNPLMLKLKFDGSGIGWKNYPLLTLLWEHGISPTRFKLGRLCFHQQWSLLKLYILGGQYPDRPGIMRIFVHCPSLAYILINRDVDYLSHTWFVYEAFNIACLPVIRYLLRRGYRPRQTAINDICTHDQTKRMLLGRTYEIRTLPKQYRIKRLALYLRYGLVPDQEAINKASIAGHQAILNVLHQHGIYPSTMGMVKLRLQQDLRATSRGQIFALVILSVILTILVLVL